MQVRRSRVVSSTLAQPKAGFDPLADDPQDLALAQPVVLSPTNVYPAGNYEIVMYNVFVFTADHAEFSAGQGQVIPYIVCRSAGTKPRYQLDFLVEVSTLPSGGSAEFEFQSPLYSPDPGVHQPPPETLPKVTRTGNVHLRPAPITLDQGVGWYYSVLSPAPNSQFSWVWYNCTITQIG